MNTITTRGVIAIVFAMMISLEAHADVKTIEGTATYRERIAIEPDTILEVELRDVSRADASAPLLASIAIKPTGQVPIPFTLHYDSALIAENMTYAVSATLRRSDDVLFRTTTAYHVLTRGNTNRIDVVMEAMPMNAAPRMLLSGPIWLVEDINGNGVIDRARTTIAFAEDGTVSGSGGCNSFHGTAALEGSHVKFSPLGATRKACVPALMDQEAKFFAAIAKVTQFQISEPEGKLFLKSDADETLLTLTQLTKPH